MKDPLDYERTPAKKLPNAHWTEIVGSILGFLVLMLIVMLLSWWKTGSPFLWFYFAGAR